MYVIIQVWAANHFSLVTILLVEGWINTFARKADGGISKKQRTGEEKEKKKARTTPQFSNFPATISYWH
jgi:hypothetical protein